MSSKPAPWLDTSEKGTSFENLDLEMHGRVCHLVDLGMHEDIRDAESDVLISR